MPHDKATKRQILAADPGISTWLSANAGSGKTRVLTDRVARLLLQGVRPLHILCLTYTKAAASEMQNRLFRRLGEWAMLGDDPLREALERLGIASSAIDDAKLREARRLFARAIETPGGLKIQTIHSFCSSLLRRFPLEAGVSPQFGEIDDLTANILRDEILEEMANGPDAPLVRDLAQHVSDQDLGSLTREITRHREKLARPPNRAAIWNTLGLNPAENEKSILSRALGNNGSALLKVLLDILPRGSANDVRAAKKLSAIDPGNIGFSDLEIMESVFLSGKGAKHPFSARIDTFPTKNTRMSLGNRVKELNMLMQRIETARQQRLSLQAAHRTLALHAFAHVFLKKYEMRKQQQGWLDFDDLILCAKWLLQDPGAAQWILFRLDGGIDHILVDEAQDTSPDQWEVIRCLAQEFAAGVGARPDVERTIFVVGDRKQSIYSFQGADPDGFDRMRGYFQDRITRACKPFQNLLLEYSFRSAEPILRLVDNTFRPFADTGGMDKNIAHKAFRNDMPGRVDLWPLVPGTEVEMREWHDPVDKPAQNHHDSVLASRIAGQIEDMLANATIPHEKAGNEAWNMRPVRPGDFLILVQGRQNLFFAIIQACKARNLPVAGADMLKIGTELAVRDLVALLSFLTTPDDNLSLAAVLRSPLFGLSEQQLFTLAHGRKKNALLFDALKAQRKAFPEVMRVLDDLRDKADFMRPYDLIERILNRHDGRRRLIGRLGPEAEDGIDALLSRAMFHETIEPPSLTGFLAWFESEEIIVKRRVDSAGDRIRVMTVHGAKGLEAPIVILPDTLKENPRSRENLLADGSSIIWRPPGDSCPESISALHDREKKRQTEEKLRLLYVAMTRAEKWLIVCGAGAEEGKSSSWYEIIRRGMKESGAFSHRFAFDTENPGLRLQSGAWETPPSPASDAGLSPVPSVPAWAFAPAPALERPKQPLSPSDLGGAKVLPLETGHDEGHALRRGRQVHLLLEHLPHHPRSDWPEIAPGILAASPDPCTEHEMQELLQEATRVLTSPGLAYLFAPQALREVGISVALPELDGQRINGKVDLLLEHRGKLLAVDFKTNRIVPERVADVPEGLLRQMGAYVAALARICPGRKIESAILWTHTASLMVLPNDLVTAALRSTKLP